MAVTATFKADFSDFTAKVGQAEKDLKTFETSSSKVGPSLTAMGKQGESAFSKMTGALGPLGAALGVTFSVGAVVAYGKALAGAAEDMVRLSAQTGISLDNLERFRLHAEGAGQTVDQMAAAMGGLQKNLASGGANDAIEKLGLNLDAIRTMRPEDQLIAVGQALAGIEDPALRVGLAMEIGGRQMVAVIPTIVAGLGEVKDQTLIVTAEAYRAWEQMGNSMENAWGRLKARVMNDSTTMFSIIHQMKLEVEQLPGTMDASMAKAAAAIKAPPALPQAPELPKVTVDFAAEQKKTEEALRKTEEQVKKNEAAFRTYQDALKNVTQYGGDFHTSLQEINGETRAAVEYYLKAGASASNLATVYGLTDAQVKAISADLKFQESVITQNSKAWANVSTSIANAESRMVTFREQAYGIQSDMTLMNEGMDRMGAAGAGMGYGMQDGSAMIGEAMGRNKQSIGDFLSTAVGGFDNFAKTGLAGIVGAFTGPGGIAGAAQGMATSVIGSLMGMIPLVGPFISQFAGPIMEGFKKIGGALKGLFGGPDADELAGREVVDKFQVNIASMLTETQKLEAGGEQWKATVIGIRDAYLAQGLTAEEAMKDAERLWGATGSGAEASKQVIEEVSQKMKGMGTSFKDASKDLAPAAITATEQIDKALTDNVQAQLEDATRKAQVLEGQLAFAETPAEIAKVQGAIKAVQEEIVKLEKDVTIKVNFEASRANWPSEVVAAPGFASGTGGRFVNFGQGTLALLHGRERVMTEGEAPGTDPAMLGALQAIRRDLQRQPELIALQLRAALAQV